MRAIVVASAALALTACQPAAETGSASASDAPSGDAIQRGRYLVKIAGCNDCHSAGYIQSGGKPAEAEWLRGGQVGYHGPWGTTYASNLRLTVNTLAEEDWVEMLGTRTARPIMPWSSVNAMTEDDRRALYRYIKSLPGEVGPAAPEALPPGQTPVTPYEDLNIKTPPGGPSPG